MQQSTLTPSDWVLIIAMAPRPSGGTSSMSSSSFLLSLPESPPPVVSAPLTDDGWQTMLGSWDKSSVAGKHAGSELAQLVAANDLAGGLPRGGGR